MVLPFHLQSLYFLICFLFNCIIQNLSNKKISIYVSQTKTLALSDCGAVLPAAFLYTHSQWSEGPVQSVQVFQPQPRDIAKRQRPHQGEWMGRPWPSAPTAKQATGNCSASAQWAIPLLEGMLVWKVLVTLGPDLHKTPVCLQSPGGPIARICEWSWRKWETSSSSMTRPCWYLIPIAANLKSWEALVPCAGYRKSYW